MATIPEGYEVVPVNWCRLCCDGRLSCVCPEGPAFQWQKVAGETNGKTESGNT